MLAQEPVSTIMTRSVVTVQMHSRLREAEKLMKRNHIRHMPVVDGERLGGMLSLNDLLRLSFVDAYGYEEEEAVDTTIYQMLTVEQVMATRPRAVRASQPIHRIAEIFTQEHFHALPVVEGNQLVGIVTTTDVIRYLMEKCQE